MDVSMGFVWLKLDFMRYSNDKDTVRYCDVEELLLPYYNE